MRIRTLLARVLGAAMIVAFAANTASAAISGPTGPILCGSGGFLCIATITFPALGSGPLSFTTNNAPTLPTFNRIAVGLFPSSATLQPAAFNGTGSGPAVGAVDWNFDLSRGTTVPNSSIVSNQVTADYPATLDLYFHIRGTLGATPGVTYQSITPLHLQDANVNNFDPTTSTLTLLAPVNFEDVSRPGIVAFTLNTITLTLS